MTCHTITAYIDFSSGTVDSLKISKLDIGKYIRFNCRLLKHIHIPRDITRTHCRDTYKNKLMEYAIMKFNMIYI